MAKKDSIRTQTQRIEKTRVPEGILIVDDDFTVISSLTDFIMSPRYCPFGSKARIRKDYDIFTAQSLEEAQRYIPELEAKFASKFYVVLDNTFLATNKGVKVEELWEELMDDLAGRGSLGENPSMCYSLRNIVLYTDDWHRSFEIANNAELEKQAHIFGLEAIVDKPRMKKLLATLNTMADDPYRHLRQKRRELDFE